MSFIADFIYYNTLGFIGASTFFLSMEYLSEPENFIQNIRSKSIDIAYWTFDKVITIKHKYDDLGNYYNNRNKNNKKDKIDIFCYDKQGSLIQHIRNETDKEFHTIVYNKKQYFVNSTISHQTIKSLNYPPFLNVELIIPNNHININEAMDDYNNSSNKHEFNTYNIYDKLKLFFIKGNVFDDTFFKAFMKYFYKLEIENYFLHVITNKCETKTITQNQMIKMNDNFEFERDVYDKEN